MEVEIRPEPDEPEAVLGAIKLLLSADGEPPPYRSAWRESGILESVDDGDADETERRRERPGTKPV